MDYATPSLFFLAIVIAYYFGHMIGSITGQKTSSEYIRDEIEKGIRSEKDGWARIQKKLDETGVAMDLLETRHDEERATLEAQRDNAAEYVTAKALVVLERHGIGPPEVAPLERLIREFTRMRKRLVNLSRIREYNHERPEYDFNVSYVDLCIEEASKGLDWETIYPEDGS